MVPPMPAPRITARKIRPSSPREQLDTTIRLIGQGIKQASADPLVRMHAAEVAARAGGWKNYTAQLRALYDDLLSRWTYVRDPIGQEALQLGRAAWNLTMGAATRGKGYGDCDDATIALGAMARAIGLEPRIVIMAAPGGRGASHVYPEIHIPGRGWIPADPVARPRIPFGMAAPAQWRRRFDLDGRPIGGRGRGAITMRGIGDINGTEWESRRLEDYGLAGTDGEEPENWNDEIVSGFGAYVGSRGIIANPGLLAEVEPITVDGYAMTPMLELSLSDYDYVQQYGEPYEGMLALGEDGSTYAYEIGPDGIGFFKKLFKAGKKMFKRIKRKARKLVKKLPGGKYLVKLHDKAIGFARKLVKPLAKFVGPIAKRLAPIAALVPGYGTAIAAALYTTGKAADLIKKFDVKQDKKGRPVFKSPQQAKQFKAALKQQAEGLKRRGVKPGHLPKGSPEHAAKVREIMQAVKARVAVPRG